MDEQKKPCALCGMVKSISEWMARPFSPQGSALQWVLFVGLLIVAVWFWQVILLDLREEI